MAFSEAEIPLLATGDHLGTINFWNLNEKIIYASLRAAHDVILDSKGKSLESQFHEELAATSFRLGRR